MLRNFSVTFAICRKTTIFAIRNCVALTLVSMNRFFIILSTLLALLSSCSGKRQGEAVQSSEGFNITGVWELIDRVSPIGAPYMYGGNSTGYKMYDTDSTFYNFSLTQLDGRMFVVPHSIGCYIIDIDVDTSYVEGGREMPLSIIDDSTIVTIWKGKFTETWRRVSNIPTSRKEEFRTICRIAQQEKVAHKPFELEIYAKERELKHILSKYYGIVIMFGFIVMFAVVYAIVVTHRKRHIEQKLAAIKEELQERSTLVIDAIKQEETNFFQSDYYQALRPRLAAGENMTDEDWREMEQQINSVYTGFSRKLRSLYDFSDVEFQVCLLIKLGVSNNDIAAVINRAPNSVSSIRGRLHKKVLGPDGGAKEWDDFVLSL